ncbi:hypothetical protein KC332_g13892 [Hortaea werneckii]|nr:hypothetical protein KC358_g13161 [Hortaea werneckii]KAI6809574.1 hypothetical protein KC350_g12881 [Hortaea werneckii]KAI6910321.1 hypothetical protein KC348_g13249 [Hortaea werneckii]KAI6925226.1 hypothetical protein KC341_g13560 [Hortaea werneckii]KAI6959951.1 hypothetical protein KC321_g13129 [Hortaea werneckii]
MSGQAAEKARLERQRRVDVQPSGRKSTSPIPEEDELHSVAQKPRDGVLSLGSAPDMKRKKKTGSAVSAEEVVYKPGDRMSKMQTPSSGAANVNRSNGGVPVPVASSHVLEAGSDSDDQPLRKKAKTASAQAGDVDGEGGVAISEPRRNPMRRRRAPVVEAPASLQPGPQRARGKGKGKAKEPSPEPEESESESSVDDESGSEDEDSESEGSGNSDLGSEDEECMGDKDIDPKKEELEQLDDEVAEEEGGDEESETVPQPEPSTSRRRTRATAAPTPIAKAQAKKRGGQRFRRNAARFEGEIDVGVSADKISPLTPEQREQGLAEFDQDARYSLEARKQLAQDVADEVLLDSPMSNVMVNFYLDNGVDFLLRLLKRHISEDRRAVIGRREASADEVFARLPAPTEEELSQAFCYLGRLVSKETPDSADESPDKVIYGGSASSPKPFGGFSRWRQYLSVRRGKYNPESIYWTSLLVKQKYRPQLRMVAGMDKIDTSPVVVVFLEGFLVDFFGTMDEGYAPKPGSAGERFHRRAYEDAWKAAVPPRRMAFAAHGGANHAHPLKQGVGRHGPKVKYVRYVLEFKCPVEVCDVDRTGFAIMKLDWRVNKLPFVHARYICDRCHVCMQRQMKNEKLNKPSQIDEVKFNSARQGMVARRGLKVKHRRAEKEQMIKDGLCYGCSEKGTKVEFTDGVHTNPWGDLVKSPIVCKKCLDSFDSGRRGNKTPVESLAARRAFVAHGGLRERQYQVSVVQNLTCYGRTADGHKPYDDYVASQWVKWEDGDDKTAYICHPCRSRTMRGYQAKGSPIDQRSNAQKLQHLRAAWKNSPW